MNIYQSINAIMAEVGAISKDRTGQGINYSFRGIEDIYACFHPLLIKHKVFCAPKVTSEKCDQYANKSGTTTFRVSLIIDHVFYAEDGSSVTITTAGEGIDTSDKATNKAMSGAFKYAFFELFCIPTAAADDSDYAKPEVEANTKKTQPAPYTAPAEYYETQYTHSAKVSPDGKIGEYVCKVGKKYAGLTLDQIGEADVTSYKNWIIKNSKEKNKPIEGDWLEFITMAEKYINQDVPF